MPLWCRVGVLVLGGLAAACSTSSDDPDPRSGRGTERPSFNADVRGIESDLERQIDKKLGVGGTSVTCPTKVSWRVGDSFFCDVASPGSEDGFAEVTLERASGRYRWYISNTCEDEVRKLGYQKPDCVVPTPTPTGGASQHDGG